MNIQLHRLQYEIATDPHRYKVVCSGRRSGKSVLMRSILLKWAMDKVGLYWIVVPTYQMGKQIHWVQGFIPEINKIAKINKLFKQVKFNQTDLSIVLPNGSIIQIVSAEDPNRLVGVRLRGLGVDECARVRNWDLLWKEALRPTLTDYEAPAIFISTPKGYNHFYDLFMLGQGKAEGDYKSWRFTSYDNPYLNKAEIDQAKNDLTEDLFMQEYMAEFRKYTGLVYKEFDRNIHVKEMPDFTAEYYIRGCDRGYRNPSAICFIKVDKDGVWYQYDELYVTEMTNPKLAELIKQKSGEQKFEMSTMDSANQSDIADLRDLGLDFLPTKKMPGENGESYVRWKIQKLSERIKAGKYFVSPNCVHTIEEFEKYAYPETKAEQTQQELPIKLNDHMLDAIGDLNGMYIHEYGEQEKPIWYGKIKGTYIEPAVVEFEEANSWESDKPDPEYEDDEI